MEINEFYQQFAAIYEPIQKFERNSLPLCAAETQISEFVKLPLNSFIQEKYLLGGILDYEKNNFIGSEYIFKLYEFLSDLGKELFHCSYCDGRTLTGVNAITVLLMSLFKSGDTIFITAPDTGGHSSMPKICKRLGIHTIELPYDYENLDYDYCTINKKLRETKINGILISPSDILFEPDLAKLNLTEETILIFDATQILGLIASGKVINYFDVFPRNYPFVLAGSTHKTLPGPTNGIIMTNSDIISRKLDLKINPDYLRNVHLHQILSLIFCLEEFSLFGQNYMETTVNNANFLAKELSENGFDIIGRKSQFTETNQIFIHLPEEITHDFYLACQLYNITLNERYRKLYKGSGIRIGTQQISRYGWNSLEIELIANILYAILIDCQKNGFQQSMKIKEEIQALTKKKHTKYTLTNNDLIPFMALLETL